MSEYRMYCDGQPVWKTGSADKTLAVRNPKYVDEIRKTASLSFTLPKINAAFSSLAPKTSLITLWEDGEIIFHGQPASVVKTLSGDLAVVCESAMGFLNNSSWISVTTAGGTIVPIKKDHGYSTAVSPATSTWIEYFLDMYSAEASGDRPVQLGQVYSSAASVTARAPVTFPTVRDMLLAFEAQNGGLLAPHWSVVSGVVLTYIDYWDAAEIPTGNQAITFGVNMLDLSDQLDEGAIFTVLTAYDSDNNNWYTYQDADHVAAYGTIHKGIEISGINSRWSSGTLGLQTETQRYYNENAYGLRELKLKALDLSVAGVDVSRLRVGFYNRVLSPAHGLDVEMQCQKITRLLDQPGRSVYEFGQVRRTLTGQIPR